MKKFILALLAMFLLTACPAAEEEGGEEGGEETEGEGEEGAEEEGAEEEGEEAEEEAEEEPAEEANGTEPGTIRLEQATLPTMGHTMMLPVGFSRDRETETGAGYSYDLGDYNRLMVGLESQGATDADNARSLAPIVAGGLTVANVETPEEGRYVISFETRESDGMQAIAVFTSTHYAKCMGPEAYVDTLREMCTSLTPAE